MKEHRTDFLVFAVTGNKITSQAYDTVQAVVPAMYRQFENSFRGIKNFAVAWIVGTAYQYLCNVIDPAGRDQHEL